MNSRKMQTAVEVELSQADPNYEAKNKLESKDIFYYLSRSQRDYIQDIYDSGVDKNEENKKKLGKLLVSTTITTGIASSSYYPNSYTVDIPTNVLYVINERIKLTKVDSEVIDDLYVKPISYDEYSVNKDNPFRKATVDKCLRLEGVSKHTILLPEGVLNEVYLDYIKTPTDIDLANDCELLENVHYNIIKGAIKLIQGAKENQIGYQIQNKEEIENK